MMEKILTEKKKRCNFKFKFDYDIKTIHQLDGIKNLELIKNELMLFAADLEFARKNSGPLTNLFLDTISSQLKDSKVIIDSRVTMTMPGAYPSIPGWHCDDVPRNEKYSQPDLTKISNIQHYMVLFSTVESQTCTEFVVDRDFEVEIDKDQVWNSLNKNVERFKPKTRFIKTGEIVRFDQKAIHRASPTKNAGWRLFIRASTDSHRKVYNEIRKQVQVYLPIENPGW